MLLAPLLALVPSAASDPEDTDNIDYTRTVTWDMDTPGDYSLSGMAVAGGTASLSLVNESVIEDSVEEFSAGTGVNIGYSTSPDSMILDETSVFTTTIVLQPDGAAGHDTHISEDRATDNYGAERELRIDSESNKVHRILMRFDLGSIPSGSFLNDATLLMYQNPGGKGGEFSFGVHSLNRSFNEMETTWMKATTSDFWATPGGDYSLVPFAMGVINNTGGWKSIEMTNLAECWVRGVLPNNGLIFVPEESAIDSAKDFISSDDEMWPEFRPRLMVNYTIQGNEGVYESSVLGPGTNSTFTMVEWSNGTRSSISDEYSQSPLSPDWTWLNNPFAEGGSYNIGLTLPGWLQVTGSPNARNFNTTIESNYLFTKVTSDFTATVSLRDYFTADKMQAGLLVIDDEASWFSVAKSDSDANSKIQVELCQNGTSDTAAAVPWVGIAYTHLRIVRNSTGFWLSAAPDGQTWAEVYHHLPQAPMAKKIMIGLFVASHSAAQPTVQFDYIRVEPHTEPTFQLMISTGNSTSTSDPSWTDWTSPLTKGEAITNMTGKYFRYRVYLSTPLEWYSPTFLGLTAHWERYSPSGTIETDDYSPSDFSAWLAFAADHDDDAGTIAYYFSTDGGDVWEYITSDTIAPMTALEPAISIRAVMTTHDTLVTPTIDRIRLTYGTALSTFYIEVPSEVVAGDAFFVEVWAKNGDNLTTTQLTGTISLRAMDVTGMNEATDDLAVASWLISGAGHAIIPSQRYFTTETITIEVSKDDITGLSQPIEVVPGPMVAIDMLPANVNTVLEGTTMTLEGLATDLYGNAVSDADFLWSITEGLGELSATIGTSVVFSPGEAHSTGYVNVTSNGMTVSRFFTVEGVGHPPTFAGPVPNQTAVEDGSTWTFDLAPLVYDAGEETEDLRWFVTDEDLVTASNENMTGHMLLTLTPRPNLFGHDVLSLLVVDREGGLAQTEVVVDIEPVNDAPIISDISPLVVDCDDKYIYSLWYYIEDVDNEYSYLSLSVDPTSSQYVSADDESLSLAMEYPEEMLGTVNAVVVTVTDGNLSSSSPISVTVLDNSVPALTRTMPSVVMQQGDALMNVFDLDEYFMDPDEDVLYFFAGETHVAIEITEDNWVNMFAPLDWSGEEYAIFSAVDTMGARIEGAVAITVLQVNQKPWIAGLPDLQVHYDVEFEFDINRYIGDGDDDVNSLVIAADDSHVVVVGTVLSLMYPQAMNGESVAVNVTASDEEFTDWWVMNVTISDNSPPRALSPPDHSFPEDWPHSYAASSGLGLAEWFEDAEDGNDLEYSVFSWSDNVTVELLEDGAGVWIVAFAPDANYYGETKLTIRATDTDGALVEHTIAVTITSVPDAPVFGALTEFTVLTDTDMTYDMREFVTDVDSDFSQLSVIVPAAYREYMTGTSTIIMMHFPEDYLSSGESSREIMVELRVIDQDGLWDSALMNITIVSPGAAASELAALSMFLLLLAGGLSLGLFGMVLRMRKKPFIIKDMLLVHEDGFLINRHIEADESDMDKDIFTGMLTAVLNFVEDSMSSTQEHLKFFGFEHYRIMVSRGKKIYAAIVFEGDRAKGIEDQIAKFLEKVEKIYRKSLEDWTGDIEVDFAGIELLIDTFVKEHGRKKMLHGNADSNGRLRAMRGFEADDAMPEEGLIESPSDDEPVTILSKSR
ncbi:MAG: DNRLRE domain-containing protein [Methanobacteriota archaeon]|nr:MAG: DNRLRE domain-containing protein [Euryarchaeota archaeon]